MIKKLKNIVRPFITNNFINLYKVQIDPWNYQGSKYEKQRFEKIIELAKLVPHKTILEIGAGEGHLTERLASISDKITCVEVSSDAIKRAKLRVPNAKFIEMSFEDYPLPNERFDLIVASEVLYYFKNRGEILKKIAKSGRYLLTSNAGIWELILSPITKKNKLLKKHNHHRLREAKFTTISLFKLP